MAFVALGVLGLIALVLLAKLFVAANPVALAQGVRWAGIGITALVIGTLAMRGQIEFAGFLLPVVYALARNWLPRWLAGGGGGWGGGGRTAGPSPGQASSIHTDFLELTLDHDTGALSGAVLRGRWRGRRVETLGQAELIALWRETTAEDPPSAQLVETCLDRSFPDWRAATADTDAPPRARGGAMTRAEALRVLELSGEPSPAAIVEAHRRLMMTNHPDHGGSAYLAALINEAKEVLTDPR
jgi:hypothetical protein